MSGDGSPARPPPRGAAEAIFRARYPGADVAFLAGSVLRGEATAHSDLDLVVVFDRLDHAHRESFLWQGWPVEAFVHDPETLAYFFARVDGPSGYPTLAQMIAEGLEVPAATALSRTVRSRALEFIARGPPPLGEQDLRTRRYVLTDLVDDLRAPRSAGERIAAAARMHELLADLLLRSRGRWSGRGKAIARRLEALDGALAARAQAAFAEAFAGDTAALVALAEEALRPLGGPLFEGHRLDAPPSWREKPSEGPGER